MSKVYAWWDSQTTQAWVEEAYEVDDVISEVCLQLTTKVLNLCGSMGTVYKRTRQLFAADDWPTWEHAAANLDTALGKDAWKQKDKSAHYDFELLRRRLKLMENYRNTDDIPALVHHLRSGLHRGIGGTLNPALYNFSLVGTKHLIEAYNAEVVRCLMHVFSSKQFSISKKLEFFSESRYSFGKTALLLSGGGGLGMYHFGTLKTLSELNLLPKIIAGSSAGALVGSLVAVTGLEELHKIFVPGFIQYTDFETRGESSVRRKIRRFLTEGVLMDIKVLEKFCRINLGDTTFQEAYVKTGIIFNVTVSGYNEHDCSRLLNYLTSPHVLVWSAVLASCAIPCVFEAVELMCKDHLGQIVPYHPSGLKFIDGSIKGDLPMAKLAELFNVNAFIVSQTNPWVVPLLSGEDGGGTWGNSLQFKCYKLIKKFILMEFRYRVTQLNTLNLCSGLSNLLGIFTQEYRGHVTIWPVPSLREYLDIINNPTELGVQRCIRTGKKRVYPKVSMLKSILEIEQTFDKCYQSLKSLVKYNIDDDLELLESCLQRPSLELHSPRLNANY
jgi:predicted acylesterase/phospholipase RssA